MSTPLQVIQQIYDDMFAKLMDMPAKERIASLSCLVRVMNVISVWQTSQISGEPLSVLDLLPTNSQVTTLHERMHAEVDEKYHARPRAEREEKYMSDSYVPLNLHLSEDANNVPGPAETPTATRATEAT